LLANTVSLSRKSVITLLCLSCLAWSFSAAAERQPVILVLGDSLSAGFGMSMEESWPSLLQRRLSETGYPHRVVNASISGDTTRGGLARLPRALTIHQPELVVIELGGNDGLRAIPPEEIRRNLENLVELAQETGASALITGIMIPPNYGSEYITAFRRAFQQAADSTGVPLTPFVLEEIALKPGMMQEDGIHPTAEAQPLIVDNLWPWIEPMLRSSADRP
jgi:acyl-CoA thioesterase-1